MKLNTNSNSYIIIYSAILVVIVAFLLAFVYQALKPMQDANVALDVKKQILYSLNIRGLDGSAAEAKYAEVVKEENEQNGLKYYECQIDGKDIIVASLKGMENVTCKDIFDGAKAGAPVAVDVVNQYYDYMGQFLGSLCSVVDPEVVVLGGGVSKAGQVLLEGVEPCFHKYVFHAASEVKFALASLGNDAGAYGAFKLALDAFA